MSEVVLLLNPIVWYQGQDLLILGVFMVNSGQSNNSIFQSGITWGYDWPSNIGLGKFSYSGHSYNGNSLFSSVSSLKQRRAVILGLLQTQYGRGGVGWRYVNVDLLTDTVGPRTESGVCRGGPCWENGRRRWKDRRRTWAVDECQSSSVGRGGGEEKKDVERQVKSLRFGESNSYPPGNLTWAGFICH